MGFSKADKYISNKKFTTAHDNRSLLPPANEVWVIFLHLSVILFTGGGVPGQVPPPQAGTAPW